MVNSHQRPQTLKTRYEGDLAESTWSWQDSNLATTSIVLELMGVVVLPTEIDNSYASLLHQPQYNQDQDQEMTSTQSHMPTHLHRCL